MEAPSVGIDVTCTRWPSQLHQADGFVDLVRRWLKLTIGPMESFFAGVHFQAPYLTERETATCNRQGSIVPYMCGAIPPSKSNAALQLQHAGCRKAWFHFQLCSANISKNAHKLVKCIFMHDLSERGTLNHRIMVEELNQGVESPNKKI